MKILVACFPKSGSTFLTSLIGNLPGYSIAHYVPAYERREQEICDLEIQKFLLIENQVAQHHVRASEFTLQLIRRYNLKLIVLVRNIFDCIVSLADHMISESAVFPMAYMDQQMANKPIEYRIEAIIDLAAPWYINFFVSWWKSMPNNIVRYEDVVLGGIENKLSLISSIDSNIKYLDVLKAGEAIRDLNTRINVGKLGRGKQLISSGLIDKVYRLSSYYPEVDFTAIGLTEGR